MYCLYKLKETCKNIKFKKIRSAHIAMLEFLTNNGAIKQCFDYNFHHCLYLVLCQHIHGHTINGKTFMKGGKKKALLDVMR